VIDPHAAAPIYRAGPENAAYALVLLHGRGGSAGDMLGLGREIAPPDFATLAPQAASSTWYPYRFMEPVERNQPWLDSALDLVRSILDGLDEAGIPLERVALGGFSQGACLALEYAARTPGRYAALLAFSGGLIGPEGMALVRAGSLEGTPVLMGCSDSDPHIPVGRVMDTARAMEEMGGRVDARVYPGMGHTVNGDELRAARKMLTGAIEETE
jgi:predicted esterase